MPEYIIYEGQSFTLEWYFDRRNTSQALDYFNSLAGKEQDKFLYLVKRMGDNGEIFDKKKFRHEGDGIYAFKPKPDRYLCFFTKGKKIIVTNAFQKKCQKLPKAEKTRALEARWDYQERVKREVYYE